MAVSTYQDGVKYLKISKVDAEGVDNSNSLSSLQDVRIKFSDRANPVQYNVLAITEYSDYYQYRVTTNPITSSADDFRADYGLDVDWNVFALSNNQWVTLTSWTENTDTLNIFDNGILSFPYSSNTPQDLSITYTKTGVVNLRLVSSVRGVLFTSLGGATISETIVPGTEDLYVQAFVESGDTLDSVNWSLNPVSGYTPQAGVSTPLLFEPYLPAKFEGTDCDVLYGNVLNVKLSNLYMDVDYSSNQIQAVNQEQVINNTATRAIVQDYNYYLNANLNSKYKGAKETSDKEYDTNSFVINQYTGSKSPVLRDDAIISEFVWGGGTYPEIYDGGILAFNKNFYVGGVSQVSPESPEEESFQSTLENTFPINSTPSIKQYTTRVNTGGARVAGHGFSVPGLASFMSPSTQSQAFTQTLNRANSRIEMGSLFEGWTVTTNTSGFYTASSATTGNVIYTTISESISSGERWFVTFYYQMPSTLQGTLQPYSGSTGYYLSRNEYGEYLDGLKSRGVWEIESVEQPISTPPPPIYINLKDDVSNYISGNINLGSGEEVGWLIWKAIKGNEFMLFLDNPLSGVGSGGLITQTPSKEVIQNFESITKEYGNNPN